MSCKSDFKSSDLSILLDVNSIVSISSIPIIDLKMGIKTFFFSSYLSFLASSFIMSILLKRSVIFVCYLKMSADFMLESKFL